VVRPVAMDAVEEEIHRASELRGILLMAWVVVG
jgi:hypothetical protein